MKKLRLIFKILSRKSNILVIHLTPKDQKEILDGSHVSFDIESIKIESQVESRLRERLEITKWMRQ